MPAELQEQAFLEPTVQRIREAVVDLAEQYAMSYADTIAFLSRRSFSVCAELLELNPTRLVHDAWDLFMKNREEEMKVPAKMTKEQYLLAVSEGKTDTQIAAEVGWTPGTLSYYRSKWQLTRTFTDSTHRRTESPATQSPQTVITIEQRRTPEPSQNAAGDVLIVSEGKHVDEPPKTQPAANAEISQASYVTIRIPVKVGTPLADIVDLKRSEAFATAFHMLEQVIAWAAEDMQDLLGTADVDKLQSYVDRQIGGN